ncbi:MAG: COG3014 family protein, partial [Gammaproteobacteria bacterium]
MAGALLAGLLSACASYGDWVRQLEYELAAGNYRGALAVLEDEGRRPRDALLYLLDRALLLRMDGDFAASNAAFEEAKVLMEKFSAVSVSEQAGALTINDLQRSYSGEAYERVLLHLFAALNYLELGLPREARVEILQLDVVLGQLEAESLAAGAFARYFSGLVFEALGEADQALIAYRKAYRAYRDYPPAAALALPALLKTDLLRLTARLGLAEELARYRREFAMSVPLTEAAPAKGEVIFILFSGLAPLKHETRINAVTENGELVTVAMPYYDSRLPHVRKGVLEADGVRAESEAVEDINTLAMEALQRQAPLIMARALVRAILRHEAVEKAGEEDEGLGFLVNVAGVVSERADTRSWSILPSRIYLARLALPAGDYTLQVRLQNARGELAGTRRFDIRVQGGGKRFLSLHWIDSHDLGPVNTNA